ncbi:DUF58 domain-containing protein [Ghiorsea bivora]|uniref:DUF58 domain-containing protein n=1 Tax=Ghiorsea bivora TaxID=1485545 RepID=UPI00056F3EF2|nr:DUF58 domain-containing protein [Ghiorsea bivora]
MNRWQGLVQGFQLRYRAWLLQGLSRITFWSDKFKQRLSSLGLAVAATILLTLILGANIKLSSIYQLFALLVALLLMALLVVWLKSAVKRKPCFEMHRDVPKFATVDTAITYRVFIANTSAQDVYKLSITERLPQYKPTLLQFINMREPNEEKRNWYDRHTGFYRFVWLQDWLRGAIFTPETIGHIQAGQSKTITMALTPMRRGYIHLSKLRLRLAEPLGLVYSFEEHDVFNRMLVLPKAYRLPHDLMWGGKRAFQQGGVAQASHMGDAEEFSHLREYQAGDALRRVFWPSLARLQTPLVKNYQEEYFSRAALVVDNFVSSKHWAKLEEAVSVAAGFAMDEHGQEMLLDLLFVGEQGKAEHTLTGRSIAHAEQMLESLATLQPCAGDFKGLSQMLLQQAERLNGCVLIASTWDASRQLLLQQLLALSVPCLVLVIQGSDEKLIRSEHVFGLRMGRIQQDLDALVWQS